MAEYIDREAFKKEYLCFGYLPEMKETEFDAFPSADVAPVRHGRWLDAPYVYYGAKRYVCNQCADDEYWRKRFHTVKENFCPNCGAKMDRKEGEGE